MDTDFDSERSINNEEENRGSNVNGHHNSNQNENRNAGRGRGLNNDDNGRGGQGNQQQRLRMSNSPVDRSLNNHVVFFNRFEEINISDLETSDAIRLRLNFKYIDLQLIRIITSSQNGVNIYSNRRGGPGGRNINSSQTRFSRLFLFKTFSPNNPQDSTNLVYMMEARNENVNLWNKNTQHRDNDTISIGCFIRVISSLPIKSWMRGDIPILKSQFPCFALRFPVRMDTIAINHEIASNESYAFVWNHAQVYVDYTAPMKTTCSGELCDRQRVNDWRNVQGCGCYGILPNRSSLIMQGYNQDYFF